MRKAYSVAIQISCSHGARIGTQFVLAESRGHAIVQAAAAILDEHNCDTTSVTGSFAREVAPEVLHAALDELTTESAGAP